ncbi:F0F1 ATP synthase subunit delta [Paremcibacter congregatus]|uniref:ATP synthase subunit delta n=2 Tax=Paremcibacter congregatus TaxID=2043170 RepID=A0A2G4YQ01_9PROT|nr:F0F1 ATP synthase subunit delta [Paremcibacter congregatus]QDE29316.1 F0F1 ATP synthase subunit delta [Paremcibacter congregatus]|tara:strand:- start:2245 stop:2817 length:573 start_codon:yes stop_codon:yes gene_type:complete
MASNIVSENLTITGLAGRYAIALFDLGRETKVLDKVAKDMATLSALLKESSDLVGLTLNPVFSSEDKARAVSAVVSAAKLDKLVANFVGVVAENGRLDQLQNIITEFNRILAHHNGEVSASVVTAHKLTKAQLDALKAKLKSMVGSDVNVETEEDESLLGGMVVQIGSRMIDSSLKTKLANLEESMKEVG